jgi:hypothetical protein
VHRYFLGIEWRREPGVDETIRSWEDRYALEWRKRKMHRERVEQLAQIEHHRAMLSEARGSAVTWEEAAHDWVERFAARWRERWERTPAAGA